MRTQLLILTLLLLVAGCKTTKQTERTQEIQRQADTRLERMEVLQDSVHLTTNVTTNQIVLKYSEPDTAGKQYVKEVTITGKEANTWLDKEQNKTVETTKKEESKEYKSLQEDIKEKQDSRLFSSFGSVAALILGVVVAIIIIRVLWRRRY